MFSSNGTFVGCLPYFQVEPRYDERAKGLAKYVRYNEVSLYRGFFHILLLLGQNTVRYTVDFVI